MLLELGIVEDTEVEALQRDQGIRRDRPRRRPVRFGSDFVPDITAGPAVAKTVANWTMRRRFFSPKPRP